MISIPRSTVETLNQIKSQYRVSFMSAEGVFKVDIIDTLTRKVYHSHRGPIEVQTIIEAVEQAKNIERELTKAELLAELERYRKKENKVAEIGTTRRGRKPKSETNTANTANDAAADTQA